MNSKNLIVLALVGVVVLTGALIVATSDMRGGDRAPRAAKTQTPRPSEGSMSGEATQTSVEIVSDNVETSVTVQ
ncbi:hypothetical protein A3C89_00465 [Candidatus Kaiserbacteria bacterium RIFCSPHIGHO2_02_FULL_50_50]|jgi:hypothetical protein|uniref:Uncharacterized protein n=1 Tax=Candidatus Kaiserbacteria bacterium RIFCSPHIGHO2_02_FULL_50_50 TaxID=1798492 RepID=A0A1F6DE05_9BACT|nr:MAG: hypothetical protein A3C89_00465 [Candidatus Kaiserbacteria bacterium RIFCSPHIGHO2_02_FULL_50_50]OGG89215.1 MAG: hypothetical protein A3G62_01145 [Candidatus Kaiserbacteria bacterium RIFCSPLOWO2_12_FULL_50_10]